MVMVVVVSVTRLSTPAANVAATATAMTLLVGKARRACLRWDAATGSGNHRRWGWRCLVVLRGWWRSPIAANPVGGGFSAGAVGV